MDDIDYGQFMTKPPPAVSGRKLLYDTFQAIADAREKRRMAQMEDERMRRANDLTFTSAMTGHAETGRHNLVAESGAADQRTELGRHNLATEGNATATLEQKKQEALAKLMADPKFVQARSSGDPQAMGPWVDVMRAAGLTVEDVMSPGPEQAPAGPTAIEPPPLTPAQAEGEPMEPIGADEILGPEQPPAPPPTPTGAKKVSGPNGFGFTFDPAMNAIAHARVAASTAQGMGDVAGQTKDTFVKDATKDIAPLVRLYITQGMDPAAALEKATAAVTARAGQASARRNADVAGARGERRAGQGEERLELSKGTYAWTRARDVLGQLGAKDLVIQGRKYGDMLNNLTANPNAALDAATSGQWVKLAQGGTGVISDSDMETFWHKIGGVGAKVEGQIQGLINGQIAGGKRQVVSEAVQWLASRARQNLTGVLGQMRTALETDPNVTPELRASILQTYGAMPSKADQAIQAIISKYAAGAK